MNNENNNGTLVLVHPDLSNDPAHGQGKVAVIKYDRSDHHEIYVAFNDGREAFYHPDELLQLKNKTEIFNALMENGSSINITGFKALYKIMLLQDKGTPKALYDALEIARDNSEIWDKALELVKQQPNIDVAKTFTR